MIMPEFQPQFSSGVSSMACLESGISLRWNSLTLPSRPAKVCTPPFARPKKKGTFSSFAMPLSSCFVPSPGVRR